MGDGIWWRKIKRNVIRDDNLRTVAEELEEEALRPLVLNFYIIAYMLADDDGVFDFGNGKVFKRLMYAPDLQSVILIRDALVEYGVIINVFGGGNNLIDNYYMIADWRDVNETPYKERPARTADERRAAVAQRLAESKELQYGARNLAAQTRREVIAAQKNRTAGTAPVPVVRVDFDAMSPIDAPDIDGRENDKNAKSVVIKNDDDKNAKSVVTTHNKTIQDRTGQDSSVRSSAQSLQDKTAAVRSGARAATQDTEKDSTNSGEAVCASERSSAPLHDSAVGAVAPPAELNNKADTLALKSLDQRIAWSKKCGVYEVLSTFFSKMSNFAKEKGEYEAFLLVSEFCVALSSDRNIPQVVAAMLVGQLKKVSKAGQIKPSQVAEPEMLWYLAERLQQFLGVDAEQSQKAYNAVLEARVKSAKPCTKQSFAGNETYAQSLAEQAISEDSG